MDTDRPKKPGGQVTSHDVSVSNVGQNQWWRRLLLELLESAFVGGTGILEKSEKSDIRVYLVIKCKSETPGKP